MPGTQHLTPDALSYQRHDPLRQQEELAPNSRSCRAACYPLSVQLSTGLTGFTLGSEARDVSKHCLLRKAPTGSAPQQRDRRPLLLSLKPHLPRAGGLFSPSRCASCFPSAQSSEERQPNETEEAVHARASHSEQGQHLNQVRMSSFSTCPKSGSGFALQSIILMTQLEELPTGKGGSLLL